MISILPWLRAIFRHWPASCSRHLSEMASFVRSRKSATTSACIGCVVQAYFHFVFGSYIRQDVYLSLYVFLFLTKCARKDNIIAFTKATRNRIFNVAEYMRKTQLGCCS